MKRRHLVIIIAVLLVALIVGGYLSFGKYLPFLQNAAADCDKEFAYVLEPKTFDFPADYGAHPEYQTEWWYYVGNLAAPDGQRFGYTVVLFKWLSTPCADPIYELNFAITDVDGGQFHELEQKFGLSDVAGVEADPYRLWMDDVLTIEEIEPGVRRMQIAQDDFALNFDMTNTKGVAFQGDRGYSRKGKEDINASYYYSLTRLETAGTVQIDDVSYEVEGLSWMDHEVSSSNLESDQLGWDWALVQFDDHTEVMVYRMLTADGSDDPYAHGLFVDVDGATTHLGTGDFTMTADPDATWESPHSGAPYPMRWFVEIPSLELSFVVEPLLEDQEHNGTNIYWEGASRVEGERAGEPVSGYGYLEMTGHEELVP